MARLRDVPVGDVEDPTVAHLLQAKHRELLLLLQMLSCRGSQEFLALSIEQFGAVAPSLLQEAQSDPRHGADVDARIRAPGSMPTRSCSSRRRSSIGTARSRPTSSRTSSCVREAAG